MNYLGLDYGLVHIGVSLATGPLAEPLATINTPNLREHLLRLIDTYHIDEIIIGIPDNISPTALKKFQSYLIDLPCNLRYADETLSTHDALQSLNHTKNRRRKKLEHSVAATIILQNWLDSNSLA